MVIQCSRIYCLFKRGKTVGSTATVTCGDIRLRTRDVLDRVFQEKPSSFTRYGKPVAVLIPWKLGNAWKLKPKMSLRASSVRIF